MVSFLWSEATALKSHPLQCTLLPSNSHKSTERARMLKQTSLLDAFFFFFLNPNMFIDPHASSAPTFPPLASQSTRLCAFLNCLMVCLILEQESFVLSPNSGRRPGTGAGLSVQSPRPHFSPAAGRPGSALQGVWTQGNLGSYHRSPTSPSAWYPRWVSMDGKSIPGCPHSRVHSDSLTCLFNYSVFPQTVTEHPLHARLLQAERNKACLLRSLIPLGRSRPKHSNTEATPFARLRTDSVQAPRLREATRQNQS